MRRPIIKAHGAQNDFLFTRVREAPKENLDNAARAICSCHTGIGADGRYLIDREAVDCNAAFTLFNSDGSKAELPGIGTRCVVIAAILRGISQRPVRVLTPAGPMEVR